MAEEKLDEVEQPLPSKRKPSSDIEPPENTSKIQKLEANSPSSHTPNTLKPNGALHQDDDEEEADEEDYEEEDDEDEEDEDEEDDEVGEVDRKGKGIMKEDVKGKGKLIEEPETDSSDDDDDSGSNLEDDDDSDLDEDPLAEVDLDNILPSRTRRRGCPPPRGGISLSRNDGCKDQEK